MTPFTFTTSDVIAGAALLIAAWSLLQSILVNRRQARVEQTTERLNLLQIEREKAESREQGQADMSANFYNVGKNDSRLKVFNRGKAPARNVRLDVLDSGGLLVSSDVERKFPAPLIEPQSSVELLTAGHMGSAARVHIKLTWDDPDGAERSKELHPTR